VDDSFAYRTTVPIRREVDPRLIRAAIGSVAALLVVIGFAGWVVASERRSLERARPDGRAAVPSVSPATDLAALPEPDVTETDVETALGLAVDAARAAFAADGDFLGATPERLADLQPGYTFVDGPSTTASVVSVASTAERWAAAVLGPEATCAWTIVAVDGTDARTTGGECTGAAALASIAAR
jgi:hypothetical protein